VKGEPALIRRRSIAAAAGLRTRRGHSGRCGLVAPTVVLEAGGAGGLPGKGWMDRTPMQQGHRIFTANDRDRSELTGCRRSLQEAKSVVLQEETSFVWNQRDMRLRNPLNVGPGCFRTRLVEASGLRVERNRTSPPRSGGSDARYAPLCVAVRWSRNGTGHPDRALPVSRSHTTSSRSKKSR
jgi:hypothetical protein